MEYDGIALAEILQKQGFTIKSKSKSKIVILVKGDLTKNMNSLSKKLKNLGAIAHKKVPGVMIGKVRVLIEQGTRLAGETNAIGNLSSAITSAMAENGGPISIDVGGKIIKDCANVKNTKGAPKSDFHITNPRGKPIIHISHKKGSKPTDFQQWGGLAHKKISEHPEVKEFSTKCKMLYGDEIPKGEGVYGKIKDKKLKMMSVYGVNYDKGTVDVERVDILIQGTPSLKKKKPGVYEIESTGSVHYHGDIPDGGFEPVLACMYKGDRAQFDIKGARGAIYPVNGRAFRGEINTRLRSS